MTLPKHVGSIALAASLGAAVTGGFAGCSSSSSKALPGGDGGTDASTQHDASPADGSPGKDAVADAPGEGAVSEGGGGEGGTFDAGALSSRAQAGLGASPFPVSLSGMTQAQAEQVGVGSYIVNVVSSCPDCHNTPGPPGTGYLAGGTPFGPVQSRNLTSDPNHGLRMTQAQFLETLQTGKDQKLSPSDGGAAVSLIVMPWMDYRWMSVTDLESVYAYLQLVPPSTNDVPFTIAGGPPIPMPTTFTDGATTPAPTLPPEASDAPLFSARGRAIQVPVEPAGVAGLSTADQASYGRGAYLVGIAPCGDCHTNPERTSQTSTALNAAAWLTGGRVFAAGAADSVLGVERSMSADLLGKNSGFIFSANVTETVFTDTLHNHVHADAPGTPPLAWPMPTGFEKMVPDDYHALWVYLSNQTPVVGQADKATQDAALYCSATKTCATGSTCNTATSECVPTTACAKDSDCDACQTCSKGACTPPAPAADGGTNACIADGI